MNPGYPYQQYQQPMYAPPQNLNAPGTIVIPPSNAPLYSPSNNGSTYEPSPQDDWRQPSGSGGGLFDSDTVPTPRDPGTGTGTGTGNESNSPFYNDDLNSPNSGVQLNPSQVPDQSIARTAHEAAVPKRPISYGFDTTGFRWIQGMLNFHKESNTWSVTYNRSQDDPFQGDLTLIVGADRLHHLPPGSAVQVRGSLDQASLDSRGRAMYRVEQIFELPVAVAHLQ